MVIVSVCSILFAFGFLCGIFVVGGVRASDTPDPDSGPYTLPDPIEQVAFKEEEKMEFKYLFLEGKYEEVGGQITDESSFIIINRNAQDIVTLGPIVVLGPEGILSPVHVYRDHNRAELVPLSSLSFDMSDTGVDPKDPVGRPGSFLVIVSWLGEADDLHVLGQTVRCDSGGQATCARGLDSF
jgi:hypothetical protein